MSEQTIKLMELINDGKTCNQICEILNLSNKQLYNNLTNLKNKGIIYKRKYYSNGEIIYKPISSIKEKNSCLLSLDNVLITPNKQTDIKFLVISDIHFGNDLSRIDLLYQAYDYCIKNDIHLVLNCGDLIDGAYTRGSQKIDDINLQIETFIKEYPFDKNILTFAVAGDHDHSSLYKQHQDIVEMTKNYRHDIVFGSYNNSLLSIKNDQILLFHNNTNGIMKNEHASIVLKGHHHKYAASISDDGNLNILVPTLSDINSSLPSAVEMELLFENGRINRVNLKHICFAENDYTLSEQSYKLNHKPIHPSIILNEEELPNTIDAINHNVLIKLLKKNNND